VSAGEPRVKLDFVAFAVAALKATQCGLGGGHTIAQCRQRAERRLVRRENRRGDGRELRTRSIASGDDERIELLGSAQNALLRRQCALGLGVLGGARTNHADCAKQAVGARRFGDQRRNGVERSELPAYRACGAECRPSGVERARHHAGADVAKERAIEGIASATVGGSI
jgi:hypothetical protein